MAEDPRGNAAGGNFVLLVPFLGAASAAFISGVLALGDGKMMPGWILLVASWVLGTLGFVFVPGIRSKWPRGGLSIALSVSLACAFIAVGHIEERPTGEHREAVSERRSPKATSSKREITSPSLAQHAPLIGAGARISQKSISGPNVIAGGSVTVNPPPSPNAPTVYYDFDGIKHTTLGNKFTAQVGAEAAAFQKMQSLYEAKNWKTLAGACEDQIRAAPGWLTPYLYAGVAYANLGNRKKAIERLQYVDKQAAGRAEYADAKRILEILHGE